MEKQLVKRILIVGNGFDLYHHLPTRYMDFLFLIENWDYFKKEYEQNHSEEEGFEQIEVRLTPDYRINKESLIDFAQSPKAIGHSTIERLEHLVDNCFLLDYFLLITSENKYNLGARWIDFESEIDVVLHTLEEYYRDLLDYTGSEKTDTYFSTRTNELMDLLDGKTNAKPSIYQFLHKKPHDRAVFLDKYRDGAIEFLKDDLDRLMEALSIYFQEFVGRIKCVVYSEQIESLSEICLLNFNYTYTYSTIYGKQRIIEHHPIHGDCLNGNIVLGISDDSFLNTLDYVYFQKYFQRIQKKSGNYYRRWLKVMSPFKDDGNKELYIFGHSLDSVDKGILEDFFESDNVRKIVIYYHDPKSYEQLIINLVKLFGKEYIIEQTKNERIIFEQLKPAKKRSVTSRKV